MLNNTYKWLVFVGLALAIVMVDIDMTAINLVAATIVQKLNLPTSVAQWIIDGYTMAAAALILVSGFYADQRNRKKLYLSVLAVFAIASAAIGFADSSWTLIVGRIIQGSYVAFTFTIGSSIIRDIFPNNKQGFAIGLLISIAGVAQALGPTIGEVIISWMNWRWIFLINLPISLIAMTSIGLYLPAKKVIKKKSLNIESAMLLILTLFALLTLSNEFSSKQSNIITLFGLAAITIMGLFSLAVREYKSKELLIDLELFSNKIFSSIIIIRFFISFIFFGWLYLLGHLLLITLHYSPLISGCILLSLTLTIAALSAPIGRFIDNRGFDQAIFIGSVLLVVANLLMIFSSYYHAALILCITLVLGGVANAFLFSATAVACMKSSPLEKNGTAMGIFFTCGFVGSALGVAVLGAVANVSPIFMTGFTHCMIICTLISIGLLFLQKLPIIKNNFSRKFSVNLRVSR